MTPYRGGPRAGRSLAEAPKAGFWRRLRVELRGMGRCRHCGLPFRNMDEVRARRHLPKDPPEAPRPMTMEEIARL